MKPTGDELDRLWLEAKMEDDDRKTKRYWRLVLDDRELEIEVKRWKAAQDPDESI